MIITDEVLESICSCELPVGQGASPDIPVVHDPDYESREEKKRREEKKKRKQRGKLQLV